MDEKLLKQEELAAIRLRSLYRKYGYLPFRMSKFEEYDLYMRNKDFLVSDRIISFPDTNGKLLALKPDVTLSIIKNGEDRPGYRQKVYYNENVYRVSDSTHRYKEIMQTGLECIGDLGLYDIYEVVSLAAESLSQLSHSFVLELSHLDLVRQVLDSVSADREFQKKALGFISAKNCHDLRSLCREYGLSNEAFDSLALFITTYGDRNKVLSALEAVCPGETLDQLRTLSRMLERSPLSDRIVLDFSVVNDMRYYNGFVFKGFLSGVSEGVLSGGQYDRMMRRCGRKSGAVGFAIYLDLLESLPGSRREYDVDVLLLCDDSADPAVIARAVEELTAEGMTVSVQGTEDSGLRARKTTHLRGGSDVC